jgi:uncharacterized protein YacL
MYNLDKFNPQDFFLYVIVLAVAIIALFVVRRLLRVSFPYFFMGLLGLIIGLAIGSLVSGPLTRLPGNYGRWLPIIINVFVTISILDLFLAQARPATQLLRRFSGRLMGEKNEPSNLIVIDTSVLIDGRIDEIIKTGFVMAKIIIPQFILNELQAVADSEDSLKRAKGRKGLEVLDHLQHESEIETEIVDELTSSREAVDSKLIKLAKIHQAKILTVDFNLNKIAKIQNVPVLNINELTEAIKPILIPGEDIVVKIIQEGKELGQGVGYLTDGTMIVVEGGARLNGREVP